MTPLQYSLITATVGFVLLFIMLRLMTDKIEQSPITTVAGLRQQMVSGSFTLVQFYADF